VEEVANLVTEMGFEVVWKDWDEVIQAEAPVTDGSPARLVEAV